MRKVQRAALAGGLVLVIAPLFAACARDPLEFSGQYKPTSFASHRTNPAEAEACRVRITDIRDERSAGDAMGEVGGRQIHADAVGWIRSGFKTLDRDPRIKLVDGPPADLDMSVEVLKAYASSLLDSKSANVVVRIRFQKAGVDSEQVYRGTDHGLDWAAGSGEAEASLNSALESMLNIVMGDIDARCAAK